MNGSHQQPSGQGAADLMVVVSLPFSNRVVAVNTNEDQQQVRSSLEVRLLPFGVEFPQVVDPLLTHASLVVDSLLGLGDGSDFGLEFGVGDGNERPRLCVRSAWCCPYTRARSRSTVLLQ